MTIDTPDTFLPGFYKCAKDDQLALLLAQRYYITTGYKLDDKELSKQLKRDKVAG